MLGAHVMHMTPVPGPLHLVRMFVRPQVKMAGTQPLLTGEDLVTMFGMFDLTKRGAITAEQVRAACGGGLGSVGDRGSSLGGRVVSGEGIIFLPVGCGSGQ